MTTTTHAPEHLQHTELSVSGMTCASCAAHIEKKLNGLDGVHAGVNFATATASVAHPASVSDAELVGAVREAGYDAGVPQPEPEEALGRSRLLAVWALTLPVIVLSMVPTWQFRGWQWLALALTVPVVLWGGWPIHRATVTNARHRATTMDTLVSLGTLVALGWSIWSLTAGDAGMLGMRHGFELIGDPSRAGDALYLEAAAGVTAFVLTGRHIEERSRRSAGSALRALLQQGAREVSVLEDGTERRTPVDALRVADLFVIRPGEKIAADGMVTEGHSAVDTSLMTGEAVPRETGVGDDVTGGTVLVDGRLVVRATRVGSDTALAQMARLVQDAQSGKAAVQRLADRVAGIFVPVVLAIAVATLLGWLLAGGSTGAAWAAAVAVLVVACPCALGLATPMALLVGTGRGARLGLLIKGPEVLENTRRIDTIVLDKTGTVTTGEMAVRRVQGLDAVSDGAVLQAAAAVERGSRHPLAAAIVRAAGDGPDSQSFRSVDGLGVHGRVGEREVVVGNANFFQRQAIPVPSGVDPGGAEGTVVLVAWDGAVRGVIEVGDSVRPTSADAVRRLRRLGLTPVLLTGDHPAAAERVAAQVGIEDVRAGVLPADKAATIRALQDQGRVVAMAGDGVNDAPALAQADLGIALGSGAEAAIEAGDITVASDDLLGVVDAVRLSRRTLRVIRQNLVWAFAYNVAAIPLAASGRLGPMVAGLAMAASSVLVVLNSLRLNRFRPAR